MKYIQEPVIGLQKTHTLNTWPLLMATLLICFLMQKDAMAAGVEDANVHSVASCITPVMIRFYHDPGCDECEQISEDVLPKIERQFAGKYEILSLDIGIMSNYVELVRYQEALKTVKNEPVYLVLDDVCILSGVKEIKEQLSLRLAELMESESSEKNAKGYPPLTGAVLLKDVDLIMQRFDKFTILTVLAAGLIDGINPCAISTLVFFMSLLAVSGVTHRRLVLIGLSFCFASFVTYMALGFGLLRVLRLFSDFVAIRRGINLTMIAILAVFAVLSFRDAVQFWKTKRSTGITLQLSDGVKARMRQFMKRGIGMGSLIFGGLLIGSSVTLLESVCTGQVYVPTLVLIIKGGGSTFRSFGYLFLFNLMFILPLVVIFTLTLAGLTTKTLLDWSRNNVVVSKILLGCCFVLLAVLIAIR